MDGDGQPTFAYEARLWAEGVQWVAGVDEAGRGALAGPVVAAAVVPPVGQAVDGVWADVRDSKQLAPARRAELCQALQSAAAAWGVGMVSASVVDEAGIAQATRQAMMQAISRISPQVQHLLIDWVRLPQLNIAQTALPKADSLMISVAAASILAKVTRDRWMVDLAGRYPAYEFALHKGYGTRRHLDAIAAAGPCLEHRHSFAPIARQRTLFDAQEPLAPGNAAAGNTAGIDG